MCSPRRRFAISFARWYRSPFEGRPNCHLQALFHLRTAEQVVGCSRVLGPGRGEFRHEQRLVGRHEEVMNGANLHQGQAHARGGTASRCSQHAANARQARLSAPNPGRDRCAVFPSHGLIVWRSPLLAQLILHALRRAYPNSKVLPIEPRDDSQAVCTDLWPESDRCQERQPASLRHQMTGSHAFCRPTSSQTPLRARSG